MSRLLPTSDARRRRACPARRARRSPRSPSPCRSPAPARGHGATIASPSGCSEPCSSDAARSSTRASSTPGATRIAVTTGLPRVSVPVLSKTTVSIRPAASSASPPRTRIPASAPLPVPTMIAVGVASPIAHGQAMITTPMNAVSARVTRGSGPNRNHATKVSAATTMTAGTKISEMRSAMRWIGAFEPCARCDEVHDPGQGRVTTDPRGAHDERAGGVEGRADDLVADPLRRRDRLAGEHRLVDRGRALDDDAVDRDLVARPDAEEIAGDDDRERHVLLDAAAETPGGRRLEADEAPDGPRRAALRPSLEPPPEEDEPDDDRGAVEVRLGVEARLVDDLRPQGHEHRVRPGGGRADRHQRVHRHAAVPAPRARRRGRSARRPRTG